MLKDIEKQFNELFPDEGIAELINESGGKLNKDLIRKKFIVDELRREVVGDFYRYFDDDSYELLDLKIEVLTAVMEGKVPKDIPRFYDIFELLPPDGEIWD